MLMSYDYAAYITDVSNFAISGLFKILINSFISCLFVCMFELLLLLCWKLLRAGGVDACGGGEDAWRGRVVERPFSGIRT